MLQVVHSKSSAVGRTSIVFLVLYSVMESKTVLTVPTNHRTLIVADDLCQHVSTYRLLLNYNMATSFLSELIEIRDGKDKFSYSFLIALFCHTLSCAIYIYHISARFNQHIDFVCCLHSLCM